MKVFILIIKNGRLPLAGQNLLEYVQSFEFSEWSPKSAPRNGTNIRDDRLGKHVQNGSKPGEGGNDLEVFSGSFINVTY